MRGGGGARVRRLAGVALGQFAFVGPASGEVSVRPELLRRGKSTAFVGADLHGDAGLATRAMLCFAEPRASALAHSAMPPPPAPPPADCEAFPRRAGTCVLAAIRGQAGGWGAAMLVGGRPGAAAVDTPRRGYAARNATALVALADVAPPAAMAMFAAFAPISTMTWSVEMLAAEAAGPSEGWLLLRSAAQTVEAGYSTQIMQIWDEAGRPLISATQCVAVFL